MQKVLLDKIEIEDLLDGVYRIHKRLDEVDNVIKALIFFIWIKTQYNRKYFG